MKDFHCLVLKLFWVACNSTDSFEIPYSYKMAASTFATPPTGFKSPAACLSITHYHGGWHRDSSPWMRSSFTNVYYPSISRLRERPSRGVVQPLDPSVLWFSAVGQRHPRWLQFRVSDLSIHNCQTCTVSLWLQ